MHPNHQKEFFQKAYVSALAAQAGFNSGRLDLDDDSVDITFRSKGYASALVRNPAIEFQLKCSSQSLVSGGVIKFPLSRKNYDDLRGDNLLSPRYLAVLLVPEMACDWIVDHGDHVSLHNCCFWASLRKLPQSSNSTTITVDIPIPQRLTTEVLRSMMEAASRGEQL